MKAQGHSGRSQWDPAFYVFGSLLLVGAACWLFINPELTVHLFREAAGEWICLDAQSNVAAGGTGLATSVLSDTGGPVGVGAQALLVASRPGRPS